MNKALVSVVLAGSAALLTSCSGSSVPPQGPGAFSAPPIGQSQSHVRRNYIPSLLIQHVVIIVQENRTVDNLFQFLRGANTQSYGYNSTGQKVALQSEDLAARYDLCHAHRCWSTEYNNGKLNGFNNESCTGSCPTNPAYAYVPQTQVQPYYTMAETYAFADNTFESDQGPSFPAHQYLVSGTSTVSTGSPNKASGNPLPKGSGGCDSPPSSLVSVINPYGEQPQSLETYPCFQRLSLMNEMDSAGVTWKYYQDNLGAGLWHGVDPIYSIWSNKSEMAANVVSPPAQVLTDIQNGQLANVVWVTPDSAESDHPDGNNGSGPSWVASIVNAIGESRQYWPNTAIFITWDDWGGFYDHVPPTIYNSFELGFRVPLIVVSPYVKSGCVSHVQHEFGSILHFTEEAFDLPSMGTTDARADDLTDCFDWNHHRSRPYRHIAAKYSPAYFLRRRSTQPEDEE
jgi:phospholipase C